MLTELSQGLGYYQIKKISYWPILFKLVESGSRHTPLLKASGIRFGYAFLSSQLFGSRSDLSFNPLEHAREELGNGRVQYRFIGQRRLQLGNPTEPLMPTYGGATFQPQKKSNLRLGKCGPFAKRAQIIWKTLRSHECLLKTPPESLVLQNTSVTITRKEGVFAESGKFRNTLSGSIQDMPDYAYSLSFFPLGV